MVRKLTERARAYFFHYNKPASAAAKRPRWSVHFMGVCHIVDEVVFHKIHEMKTRRRKRQPFGVLVGKCLPSEFYIEDSTAHLGKKQNGPTR